MLITPWRPLLEKALAAQKAPGARVLQLATVDVGGAPDVRSVIFRGWADLGDGLLFTADARSEKLVHTRRQPRVALCGYLPDTREQFRLAGPVRWIDGQATDGAWKDLRRRVWGELSDATRQTFLWPSPGEPRAEGLHAMPFAAPPPDPRTPLDTFVLGCVEPDRVDHLVVAASPHRRTRYALDKKGAWAVQAVNP